LTVTVLGEGKRWLKGRLLDRWNVPHSPIPNLPPCVFAEFRDAGPISIIDVGAHTGTFSVGIAQLCGLKNALLIEPIEDCADQLRGNPILHEAKIFDCAVSDVSGTVSFNVFPDAPYVSSTLALDTTIEGLSEFAGRPAVQVDRPMRTLDSIVEEAGLRQVDLLKIDVQGLEAAVIRGATNTLAATNRVYLEVSFRPVYEHSCVFEEVYAALNAAGFRLMDLEPGFRSRSGELLQADALFGRL
jgi:FkbM family methyltransferase